MDNLTKLDMLKIDLGINGNNYDTRLKQYLTAAASAISDEGITLDDSIQDGNLQIMYASWLWRKRAENVGMPRNLRWMLNNRLFREKVNG